MSHQFKPGDLALVVKGAPANIGRCVELVRSDSGKFIGLKPFDDACYLNKSGEVCWVVRGDLLVVSRSWGLVPRECCAIPESWLIPLRGDFIPEQQKTQAVPA